MLKWTSTFDMDTRTESLIERFEQHYGTSPSSVAIAPGRVNLIGEHTDYNDGFVLPIALQRDVRIVLKPRQDKTIRLLSADYDSDIQFDINAFEAANEMHWSNYVKGMVWALQQLGVPLTGFDGIVAGNVPKGSGLSSSAAFEVAMGKALLESSAGHELVSPVELAKAAQSAENNYVGVNCGIMDQFISVLGTEDHALLIDCRSLAYRLVSVPKNVSIVIGNTKASRSLAGSAYNERRAQCEEGVALLQQKLPTITALRDVTSQQLDEHRTLLSPIVYQRCRHVVSENERVMAAVEALESGDLSRTGELMTQSHSSLRDDYAVSSEALDVMVSLMGRMPGCYGARLTGAGFGGCTVALVDPGHEQAVADAVYDGYSKVTNIWPEVYTTQASDGSRIEKL